MSTASMIFTLALNQDQNPLLTEPSVRQQTEQKAAADTVGHIRSQDAHPPVVMATGGTQEGQIVQL